jgi:hypothetical protein
VCAFNLLIWSVCARMSRLGVGGRARLPWLAESSDHVLECGSCLRSPAIEDLGRVHPL